MAPELALGGLQSWMQSVIAHPGPIQQALTSGDARALLAPERVGDVLLPSATLAPRERIGIYHEMYLLRMAEALESDYPALAHFFGETRWPALVRDYVRAYPSRSYTLNVLGRSLADWLGQARDVPRRGFCQDLARLEWAVTEAFDADETKHLSAHELGTVPPDAWDEVRLVPSAALRLVELRWNANEWLDSAKGDDHDHPKPRRRAAWVAVFRQSYAVYRRELSHPAFRLLQDLTSGRSVGTALAAALRRRGTTGAEALTRWFQEWASDGLFTRLEVRARAPRNEQLAAASQE